jgi:transposase
MLKEKLQEIDQLKSKLAKAEQSLLDQLHSMVGFASRSDLVKKLQSIGSAKVKKTAKKAPRKAAKKATRKAARKVAEKAPEKAPEKVAKKAVKKVARKSGGRRKRTTITPELRNDIIAEIKGGATGAAVAKKFGVSVPTVQNIKKAAGLIRKG